MQIPLDAFDFLTALRSALSSLPVWGSDAKALATMLSTSTRRGPDRDVASELSVKPHNRLFGAGEDGQAKDSYCSPDYSKMFLAYWQAKPDQSILFRQQCIIPLLRCQPASKISVTDRSRHPTGPNFGGMWGNGARVKNKKNSIHH